MKKSNHQEMAISWKSIIKSLPLFLFLCHVASSHSRTNAFRFSQWRGNRICFFFPCGCLGSQHKHDNHMRPGPLGCAVKSQKYQFKNSCLTCNNRKSLRQNSETNIFCLKEKVHCNLSNLYIKVPNNQII